MKSYIISGLFLFGLFFMGSSFTASTVSAQDLLIGNPLTIDASSPYRTNKSGEVEVGTANPMVGVVFRNFESFQNIAAPGLTIDPTEFTYYGKRTQTGSALTVPVQGTLTEVLAHTNQTICGDTVAIGIPNGSNSHPNFGLRIHSLIETDSFQQDSTSSSGHHFREKIIEDAADQCDSGIFGCSPTPCINIVIIVIEDTYVTTLHGSCQSFWPICDCLGPFH